MIGKYVALPEKYDIIKKKKVFSLEFSIFLKIQSLKIVPYNSTCKIKTKKHPRMRYTYK